MADDPNTTDSLIVDGLKAAATSFNDLARTAVLRGLQVDLRLLDVQSMQGDCPQILVSISKAL